MPLADFVFVVLPLARFVVGTPPVPWASAEDFKYRSAAAGRQGAPAASASGWSGGSTRLGRRAFARAGANPVKRSGIRCLTR